MDVAITELEKIEADRVDGVAMPANGIGILVMKQLAAPVAKKDVAKAGARDCPKCGKGHDADHKGNTCTECGADLPAADDAEKSAVGIVVKAVTDGMIDQAPDISLGHQIMGLLAQAIIGEAQEIGAGSYGETCDVDLLNCAAAMISRWTGREAAPGEDGDDSAMMLMQSAAKALGVDLPAAGETGLPATGTSGDDTAKSQIAKESATVDTTTQGTGDLAKVVEDAVAEATAPLKEQVDLLKAELAKVKAQPVPGGPVMSAVRPGTGQGSEDYAAKARYFDEWAERLSDPSEQANYRQLAARERAKITVS